MEIEIIGNPTPEVGVAEKYTVKKVLEAFDAEPLTLIPEHTDAEIKWNIYVLDSNVWRLAKVKEKKGESVEYKFSEISPKFKDIAMIVEAYGKETMIHIKPQPTSEPKITFIELLDVHKKEPKKGFTYGNWIIARVHCVGMELRPIVVTLWEDDGAKKKNTKIEFKKRFVKRGFVDARFYLNPMHADLANSKADKGESDEGQFHEYYITAEIEGKAKSQISTENTTVANPLYLEKKLAVKNEISIDLQQQVINSLMMVDVSGDDPNGWWNKKEDTCVCKKYDLIWGNKVSCDFRKKVIEISRYLWKDNYLEMANNLMAVFYWETGGTFKPDVPNQAKSGATGLVQFMPERANEYFGKHTIEIVPNYFNSKNIDLHNLPRVKEFAEMTDLKQLEYVKKYFESQKNKKLKFVDFYLQVLFPVSSGKDEHVVFADKESKLDLPSENKKIKEKRVSKYLKNSGFDLNKDGKIFKSDIEKMVQKYKIEGIAYKIIAECKNTKESNTIFSENCTVGEVVDGFIINDKVVKNKVDSCNKTSMPEKVEIIVLHRTAGGKASGTLNWMNSQGYGAHFINDYDGTMYQAIGLDKKASHMGVNRKKNTLDNGWGNGNSIGIETCGLSLDKDGINTLISKKTHDHWEPVTDKQAQSIACLIKFLLNHFKLTIDDVKVHEDLCSKTELEGKLVYDAMSPYLK